MCERIRRDTGFEETISPHRFRTTALTDLYDITKDMKQAQAADQLCHPHRKRVWTGKLTEKLIFQISAIAYAVSL